MNWRVKGVIQKTLSILPGGRTVNDLFQHTIGGLRHFSETVHSKVRNDWLVLVAHMNELGLSPAGLRYMEIGTGWFPTLPICYSLAGAASCVTFDLVHHLNVKLTMRMLATLETELPSIAQASGRSLDELHRTVTKLRQSNSVPELLAQARIQYRAPADATSCGLPDGSVDVIFSNSVLEHVPREVIRRLMQESHRVLRRGGVAIHSANCADHYAYFDRQITFINYLQFPESKWRFWNNELQYQNRLRPQDFTHLAEEAGLEVILEKHRTRPELLAVLPHLDIAPEFQYYPADQLCSTSVDFVAQKK